ADNELQAAPHVRGRDGPSRRGVLCRRCRVDLMDDNETAHTEHSELEQDDREEEQVHTANRLREPARDLRASQRAEPAANPDETEETLGLVEAPDVGHKSAEHRYDEQIEDTEPDEERVGRPEVEALR